MSEPRSVEDAVRADLEAMEASVPGVASSGPALAVLALARDLDFADESRLSERVAAAREIRECLAAIRSRVPVAPAADRLDELARARERRRGQVGG